MVYEKKLNKEAIKLNLDTHAFLLLSKRTLRKLKLERLNIMLNLTISIPLLGESQLPRPPAQASCSDLN